MIFFLWWIEEKRRKKKREVIYAGIYIERGRDVRKNEEDKK